MMVSDDPLETNPTDVLRDEPETETKPTIVVHNNVHSQTNGIVSRKVGTRSVVIVIVLVALFLAVVAWVCFPLLKSSAEDDIGSFSSIDKANNEIDDIENLATDSFSSYAQAYCVTHESADKIRNDLQDQLDDLPMEAREKIIKRAVIEGATQNNSMEVKAVRSDGRAYFFKAFWSTTYVAGWLSSEIYTTCLVVSGMDFTVAETVAESKVESKKVLIGFTPCECGYILPCSMCPVFDTVETKEPVYKRPSLTLKQQKDLANRAIAEAEELAGNLGSAPVLSKYDDTPKWANPKMLGF